jgi:hypothetical protein
MRAIRRVTLLLGALAASAGHPVVHAATDCQAVQRLSPLDNRLARWAAQGVNTLRQRVTATKSVYRFNVHDAMETGMRHHEARKACGLAVADAGGLSDRAESTQ